MLSKIKTILEGVLVTMCLYFIDCKALVYDL